VLGQGSVESPVSGNGAASSVSGVRVERSNPQVASDFVKRPGGAFTLGVHDLSEGSPDPTLLTAAFAALLHRFTQQEAFQIGLVSQRLGGSLRELSLAFDESTLGRDLVARVRQELEGAALSARDEDFTAGVLLEDGTLTELTERATARFPHPDLALVVSTSGGGARLIYNFSLFLAESVARMGEHLAVLTRALEGLPETKVNSLPLLTPEQAERLKAEFTSPRVEYPDRPVHRLFERFAAERPDALALTFADAHLTYGELNARANRLAHYLLENGVKPGDRVAVCVEPSFDILIALLALFKVGATHVPLDPTYPTERLEVILDDVAPTLLLAQSGTLKNLPADKLPKTFLFDRDFGTLDARPSENPDIEYSLETGAYIVYTSGTTGKPKGVVATHANLVFYLLVAQQKYRFCATDVQLAFARFTFSITFFELLSMLVAGGRLVILERDHVFDFKRLVKTLETTTVIHASPSLLRKLLAHIRDNQIPASTFDNLRHVSSGGDLVSPDVIEGLKPVFRNAELYVIYGSSEIACMGCTFPIPRDREVTRSFVGKPFDNVSVRLYDEQQNLVPIGVAGEIYFGGAGITRGYLNRDDLTREKFIEIDGQRFYRMGDVGRIAADGNLEILGRTDFQIKLRGIRIELGEIESTLRTAPGVKEAVCAARELGSQKEKSLVAYVVLDPASPPDVKDLRRMLQAKLPDYMVPAAFVVLDALPVNMNQKLDRRGRPAEDLARLRTVAAPRTDLERRLVAVWESVLETTGLGVKDGFFDVGGDSLKALGLMIEIERTFQKTLPMSTLLTHPTIEDLAALIEGKGRDQNAPILLKPSNGARPPVFLIHDGDGEVLLYRNLALRLHRDHAVYGIAPYSRGDFPMLHSRMSDVVDHYTEQIRKVQPHGPYLLGGLCIGGFIAFEIARKLELEGEQVAHVALIDVAHVTTPGKSVTARRLDRFSAVFKSGGAEERRLGARLAGILRTATKKARNVVVYEARSRARKLRNNTKMRLFRFFLDNHLEPPDFLKHLTVTIVLRFAEKEYVIPEVPYQGEIVLFRATKKDPCFDGTVIDDTPYIELFQDPELGWRDKARTLHVHDVPGGHSSMLQEPHVKDMAELIQRHIDESLDKLAQASLRVAS
jgi:amino acid adenylation domain-containing protein